ncbi:MAG: diacylglycerol kinase family lipid kinase [Clostridia bacterium]|nr:diacylglycerol kinase family lipid kinase [Clostridia bacterium]
MSKKLLVVVNPTSGKMKMKQHLLQVCQIFCEAECEVCVYVTAARRDAERIVAERCNDFDVVVSCGGDGTFNEVVTGALKANYQGAVGFLPCGTTNDLAETMGIPKLISDAAKTVVTQPPRAMDFGRFNEDQYFTYVATFGAFSDVAYSTDQKLKNLLGHAAYMAEALVKIKDLRSYRMKICCDGEIIEDEFLFGAVANSLSIGGVMKLNQEDVNLCDGYHELVLMKKPKTAMDLGQLSKEFFSGKFENKAIILLRGKEFSFESEEPIPWCIDGEFAGEFCDVRIQNLSQKLSVIRP